MIQYVLRIFLKPEIRPDSTLQEIGDAVNVEAMCTFVYRCEMQVECFNSYYG